MNETVKANQMSAAIAGKNDALRKDMVGCRIIFTVGVRQLWQEDFNSVVEAVRNFSSFSEDNDPRHEHDFGKVTHKGVDYFWKFDYYDDAFEGFKEDGNRVLTIMRADEY